MKTVKKAIIESSQANKNLISALEKANISYEISDQNPPTKSYRKGKQDLHFTAKKGDVMHTCATISNKYICCNVKVIKSVSNCPFDCSYCFLQNYLNDGNSKVVNDIDAMIEEVKLNCKKEPNRLFRIGTWELGDSLAFEKETKQAELLIEKFKDIPNAVLELKTKSNIVDPILNCDHQQKTVVSWSLNTNYIIETQEHKTARLHERIEAINKVTKAGYLIGLHFDPTIIHPNWESEYTELIESVCANTDPSQIAWISLGSLRFNPEMKKKIESNFPKTSITYNEMILGDDGKVRYPKPTRIKMYKHIIEQLEKHLNCSNLSPLLPPEKNKPLFYFCMERWDIWETFFNKSPKSINELDYLFAKNMHNRFYSNILTPPKLENYN